MSYFMGLIGVILVFLFLKEAFKIIMEKYSFGLVCLQKYSVKDSLTWMVKNSEMRKRLMITAGILALSQVLNFIPLPGIDIFALEDFFTSLGDASATFIDFVAAGAITRLSIGALGLMPFISACMFIQIISIFLPPLRRLFFKGEKGRQEIGKYTYALAVTLSLANGFLLSLWAQNSNNFGGMQLVSLPPFIFQVTTTITLTATVLLLLFAAKSINRYGIGNGVPLILVAAIIFTIPSAVGNALFFTETPGIPSYLMLIWLIISALMAYIIFYITRLAKGLEIHNESQEAISIPFRSTMIATVPLQIAATIFTFLTFPRLLGMAWPIDLNFFKPHSIWGQLFFGLLVFIGFSYIFVVFSPYHLSQLLKKYKFSLSGYKIQAKDKRLIREIAKILIITALFLIGISVFRHFMLYFFKVPSYTLAGLISGIYLLVSVGVFSDTISQLEFYRDKSACGKTDWQICYIAFDEIEAGIKKQYLKNKGIAALIKPFRYSWGLPIRTVVDQYQIYVEASNKEKARGLIEKGA